MSDAIKDALLQHRLALETPVGKPVAFNTGNQASEDLLNDLTHHPHAFVIACVMDRQMKAERAWLIPHLIRQRLGTFELEALAATRPEQLAAAFAAPPPLHRFPENMATNAHAAFQRIASHYGGDASRIWSDRPSSALLVLRFLEFRGVGPKIATMAANILVRDFKIPVSDRFSLDISPDVQVRRVFTRLGLIPEDSSDEQLTYTARAMSPAYPGIFDLAAWDVGRAWCRPQQPDCGRCVLHTVCPSSHAAT